MISILCAMLAAAPATPESISLRVSGDLDPAELQSQLRLRLPGTAFSVGQSADGAARPEAYVFLSPADGGYALTLILDDGRAYDRFLTPPEGDAERGVANDLASLVRAVASGDAAADREGVDVPSEEGEASAPSEASDAAGEDPSSDPADANGATESPEDPGLVWGLSFGLGAAAALSGDPLGASVNGRFRLGVLAEWPRGGTIVGGANLGVHAGTLGIVRVGAELGGGYVWTRDRFRLPILGLARFEQPVMTDELSLTRLGSAADRLPLLWGPVASLRPRWALGERGRVQVGAWLDLSWLVGANEGLGTPRVLEVLDDGTRSLAARVGGPELGVGASVVWTPGATR